ncbi:serine protease [Leptospira ognonensis]|uniref:Serine protease n=1 Tax=Leptospira ognonensis TaxID=2484945 RepID=A0A4R9K6T4_9LEPT|nr:serine protease [Leptospira ognonensis]TGL61985.1 serine protease [Leptospira ognonensis]
MNFNLRFFTYSLLFISVWSQISAKVLPISKDDNSIVQVKSTVQYPNFIQPWRYKNPETKRAYGIHVGEGLILTTTQTLNYATSIEVNKFGTLKNFTAKVVKMEHDLGLSLIKVEDKDFVIGLNHVSFPNEVFLPSQGLLLEYKEYRNLSEKKVRSVKLDMDTYSNGYVELPYVEIQSDEKLEGIGELIVEESSRIPQGLVISFKDSQNSGKMVPSFMIKQFLDCKSVDSCIPFKGFRFRPLLDKAARDFYGIKKEEQGVLVAEVYPSHAGSKNSLELEDVILEVSGYKIDPKGYFEHPKYGKLALSFLFHSNEDFIKKQNVKIPVKLIRNRKLLEFDLDLKSFNEDSIMIPFGNTRNKKPIYMIVGGAVFQELSEHYLMEFGAQWRARVSKYLLYLNDFHHIVQKSEEEKVIVLTQVLPLTGNQAYHSMHQNVLEKANGIKPKNLNDFRRILAASKEEFILLDFEDGSQIVLKSDEIQKLNSEALKTFKIPAAENF